jgi:hypothetical protein
MLTLADLTRRTGLDVLSHLEHETAIPVIDGLQAQGDLIIVPIAGLPNITIAPNAHWRDVPGTGIDVLRAGAGGNPHTLVADPGTCRWTTGVRDHTGLSLGALTATGLAYLLHPEHGGSGLAPGTYIIRRQRERTALPDQPWHTGASSRFIAD